MRIKILGCSILLMASSVFASDVTIYKWVDDKGVVHFSNSHPANKESTEVDVRVAYSAANKKNSNTDNLVETEEEKLAVQMKIERTEKNAKMFTENCKSAQANQKILTSFNRILIQDDKGNDKLLTGDDIKTQLDLTKKHIDIYCEVDSK